MRAATYAVPAAASDKDNAECVVYFFRVPTRAAGGSRAKPRALEEPVPQGGRPAPAQIQKTAIHGISVTTIDTSGAYTGMGGPMNPDPDGAAWVSNARGDSRRAVILDATREPVHRILRPRQHYRR